MDIVRVMNCLFGRSTVVQIFSVKKKKKIAFSQVIWDLVVPFWIESTDLRV